MLRAIRELGSDRLWLLSVITAGHSIIHWFQQLFPVILPSIKAGLGLNDVQIGALATARQLTAGVLNLPTGMVADSLVRHRAFIMASSLAFMGVAYFLLGVAPGFFWALPAAALVGLGTAVWHPAAVASLSNRFPERRATALAVHGMGATVSDTITPIVVGALLMSFHWRNFLEFQIGPALAVALLIWWALLGYFEDASTRAPRSQQFREIGELARNPAFIGVAVATGLMMMGRQVILTFLPIYLVEHLGYSYFLLGLYITLLHVMGTVSQPVLGFLSDRFGRKAVLLPSFLTLGVLYLLLAVVHPGIQLGLVILAIGVFFYTLLNVTNAAVLDMAGSRIHASSYGLTLFVTQFFVVPTPLVAGLVVNTYGIVTVFFLSASFQFLAALVVMPLKLYRGARNLSR
ncbi:MAG: MFS transporter [Candidatus Binatia bacterium]